MVPFRFGLQGFPNPDPFQIHSVPSFSFGCSRSAFVLNFMVYSFKLKIDNLAVFIVFWCMILRLLIHVYFDNVAEPWR